MRLSTLDRAKLDSPKTNCGNQHYFTATHSKKKLWFGPLEVGLPDQGTWLTREQANDMGINLELGGNGYGTPVVVVNMLDVLEFGLETGELNHNNLPGDNAIPLDYSGVTLEERFQKAWTRLES